MNRYRFSMIVLDDKIRPTDFRATSTVILTIPGVTHSHYVRHLYSASRKLKRRQALRSAQCSQASPDTRPPNLHYKFLTNKGACYMHSLSSPRLPGSHLPCAAPRTRPPHRS